MEGKLNIVLWNLFIIVISFLLNFTEPQQILAIRSSDFFANSPSLIKCKGFEDTRRKFRGRLFVDDDILIIPSNLSSRGEVDDDPLYFRLKKGKLNCETDSIPVDVKWKDALVNSPQLYNYSNWARSFVEFETAVKVSPIYFTPDGHFLSEDGYFINPNGGYCVKFLQDDMISLNICQPKCKNVSVACLPKCCSLDEALSKGNCVKLPKEKSQSGNYWKPEVYKGRRKFTLRHDSVQFHDIKFPENCNVHEWGEVFHKHYAATNLTGEHNEIRLSVDKNGNVKPMIYYFSSRTWKIEERWDFCADAFVLPNSDDGTNEPSLEPKITNDLQITPNNYYVFYCTTPETDPEKEADASATEKSLTYTIVSILSVSFLWLTVIIYFLVWDKLNLHGLTILFYSIAELLSFSMLVGAQLVYLLPHQEWIGIDRAERGWFCYLLAVFAHFSYFSSYMWLTVMNFDLWITFKTVRVTRKENKEWKKFGLYCAFGWGIPLVAIIVCTTLDKVYRDPWTEVPVPDYAANTCFVSPDFRGYYVHLPAGIIMLCNIVLICMTMNIFWAARKQTMSTLSTNNNANKYSAKLFAKLFVVMGGVSLIDYISWYYSQFKKTTPWVVVVLESLTYLGPVFLFYLFCLNKRTVGQLEEKYPKLYGCLQPVKKLLRIEKEMISVQTVDTEVSGHKDNIKLNDYIAEKGSTSYSAIS